jgi:thioredoxin 1
MMMAYVSEVTTETFKDFLKTGEIVMIDIHAQWCAPCKVLSPIIDTIAAEFTNEGIDIKIGKMDVDENRDIAIEYGVTSIPTILVFKNGNLIDRNTGMIQKKALRLLLEKHIV